jgi:Nif-specific regulatory protein
MNRKSKILIVDDEQSGRDAMEALLAGQDYDIIFANNGLEALAKAKELTPDLVLLDVMMPDINGFEVCRRIRKDPVLDEMPVIMVTALDDRDSLLQGINSGADDFVSKIPIRVEFQARIRTITRLNRYRKLLVANQQLEAKINSLSALYEISNELNSTIDVELLLKSIIQKASKLLNVESVSIGLGSQESNKLTGIANWVFRKGEPIMVQDINKDKRFYSDTEKNQQSSVSSVLCVPLRGKDEILGVIEAINKKDNEFTEDDQKILEAMADNIAVSIEKANIYKELQRVESLLRRQNAELRLSVKQKYRFDNIIGNNNGLLDIIKKSEQVAQTTSTVMILGETGTGKELLAQAIHQSSPRATNSFITINCSAIPENLLESELFGHEKGSFTGANGRRIGRFEDANGGTLFLDEVGDMPLNIQVRLLRVLQDGVIQRLGSNADIQVDVRIITATNHDLAQLVTEKKFRQDLYYRLKVFELNLPPLRERSEDIPLLIKHFIKHYNQKLDKQVLSIDDEALDVFCNYDYPGNIRELQHIIESIMILCNGTTITIKEIPEKTLALMMKSKKMTKNIEQMQTDIPANNKELKAAKAKARQVAEEQVESLFLVDLLSKTDGNVSEAARQAGMNRSWLAQLVSKHRLDLKRFSESVS